MEDCLTPFPYPTVWNRHQGPDYTAIFQWRQQQLVAMRRNPILLAGAKHYYKTHRIEFIEHWLTTYDPRNADTGKLTYLPFVLFERQRDLVIFLEQCLALENPGLIEKCRDMGATWLCCAYSVVLWLFVDGVSIGWGSRKEDLVDKLGDADSIFEKMRILIRYCPREFWPDGFSDQDHMSFMRIVNPKTGATITGETGDNIGRGGRKRIYFKDESAHYERPERIEAALSENTRVQIDISSVNGLGNVFERRRSAGEDWDKRLPMKKGLTSVFVMDWRDHPEKDVEWYNTRRAKFESEGLLHLFRQEIDRDYGASVTGVIIRPEWVSASIDAHLELSDYGDWNSGPAVSGLDVSDGGGDLNGQVIRRGPMVLRADEWGDTEDTGVTARRAIANCDIVNGPISWQYDSIGAGSGVKAETNRLKRDGLLTRRNISFQPWAASAKVLYPDEHMIRLDKDTPLNKDYFANLKAQGWWQVARRFERTWRAINEGVVYKPEELISIPSDLQNLGKLKKQLSQATMIFSAALGKMIVDKAPDGAKSPDLADGLVEAFWPIMPVVLYTRENVGDLQAYGVRTM